MVEWIDGDYYRNSANKAPVKAANLAWESIHVWPRVTKVNKFYVQIYPFFVNVFSKSVLFPLRSYKWLQKISLAPNWLLFDQFFFNSTSAPQACRRKESNSSRAPRLLTSLICPNKTTNKSTKIFHGLYSYRP